MNGWCKYKIVVVVVVCRTLISTERKISINSFAVILSFLEYRFHIKWTYDDAQNTRRALWIIYRFNFGLGHFFAWFFFPTMFMAFNWFRFHFYAVDENVHSLSVCIDCIRIIIGNCYSVVFAERQQSTATGLHTVWGLGTKSIEFQWLPHSNTLLTIINIQTMKLRLNWDCLFGN